MYYFIQWTKIYDRLDYLARNSIIKGPMIICSGPYYESSHTSQILLTSVISYVRSHQRIGIHLFCLFTLFFFAYEEIFLGRFGGGTN